MNYILSDIYTFSMVLILILLYISVYKSDAEKTTNFSFFVFHVLLFVLGVVIELTATDIVQVYIAIMVQYLGIAFVPVYLLFVICEFADRPIKNKWLCRGFYIMPIISVFFVVSYPFNWLFYKELSLVVEPNNSYVIVKGSIYYYIFFSMIYFNFLLAYIVVAWAFIKGDANLRKKISFILIGSPTPLIFLAIYITSGSFNNVNLLPIFMIYICVYFEYNIIVKHSFLSIPFLGNSALDDMRDGYILVDSKNNYLDSNKAAKKIFPNFKDLEMGIPMKKLQGIPTELIDGGYENNGKEIELMNDNGSVNYYAITKSTVMKNKRGEISCWLLHNVTETRLIREDLEYMANYDSLTGVYNRSMFFKSASDLFAESKKNKLPFAIFMIDIDFFKKVNDKFGHIYGDKVIVEVIDRIKSNLRENDIVGRYGGEEFVVYVENVTKEDVFIIGEKLRYAIETQPFELPGEAYSLTISIGAEVYDYNTHNSIDDVLWQADKYLYEAKETGRNKLVMSA